MTYFKVGQEVVYNKNSILTSEFCNKPTKLLLCEEKANNLAKYVQLQKTSANHETKLMRAFRINPIIPL